MLHLDARFGHSRRWASLVRFTGAQIDPFSFNLDRHGKRGRNELVATPFACSVLGLTGLNLDQKPSKRSCIGRRKRIHRIGTFPNISGKSRLVTNGNRIARRPSGPNWPSVRDRIPCLRGAFQPVSCASGGEDARDDRARAARALRVPDSRSGRADRPRCSS